MANDKIESAIEERLLSLVNVSAEDVDMEQEEKKLTTIRKLAN